jgi:hypothetical protein
MKANNTYGAWLMDAIWTALRDPRPPVREAARGALLKLHALLPRVSFAFLFLSSNRLLQVPYADVC